MHIDIKDVLVYFQIVMHYSWTIIAFIPALLILLYAVVVLALCNRSDPLNTKTACFALDNIQTGLGITNVTVGTILSATIIPFMVFVCVLCRSYSPQDKTTRSQSVTDAPPATGTVLEDAVRRQSHIIRQQQEQIELLSQRQHAMEQRIQASHMPLEAPPPYHQDDPPIVEIQKTPPPYKHLLQATSCVETV